MSICDIEAQMHEERRDDVDVGKGAGTGLVARAHVEPPRQEGLDATETRAEEGSRQVPLATDREASEAISRPHSKYPSPSLQPMPAARTLPLLICSVGNPGSTYANTLHSAGHTVLNRLAEHLGHSSFQKDRALGNGLVSRGSGDWTLWQSPSYMNESGKGVRSAFMTWSKSIPDGEGKLVIVHDELEKPLGAVSLRTAQGASAKGHNGLKSIMSLIGNTPFARIGIGIGRPVSRESEEVAKFVLKKMTPTEKAKIEGCVDQVIAKLKQLETG